jgi:hypothetical protein
MSKMSIQQFRAALSGRSEHPVVRGYRELSRRPGIAAGMLHAEWAVWPPAAALATAA